MDSLVGRLLLAASNRGVCALNLGDTDIELVNGLILNYPQATIRNQDDKAMSRWWRLIKLHLEGEPLVEKIPLDIRASSFQWRVYQQLQAIPYGSTSTYEEIAQAIGRPKASRAVGNACSNNKVALIIPCHRVIRKDGTLGGYRWGLKRKEELLAFEMGQKV